MDHLFYSDRANDAAALDAQRQANRAAGDARRARSEIEALERRIERLSLMTEALWMLLRERLDLREEDLIDRARELDLSDGVADGRVRRASVACPQCRRMVGKRHVRCLYCGADLERAPFSDV